jgi:hypothetical protein
VPLPPHQPFVVVVIYESNLVPRKKYLSHLHTLTISSVFSCSLVIGGFSFQAGWANNVPCWALACASLMFFTACW